MVFTIGQLPPSSYMRLLYKVGMFLASLLYTTNIVLFLNWYHDDLTCCTLLMLRLLLIILFFKSNYFTDPFFLHRLQHYLLSLTTLPKGKRKRKRKRLRKRKKFFWKEVTCLFIYTQISQKVFTLLLNYSLFV